MPSINILSNCSYCFVHLDKELPFIEPLWRPQYPMHVDCAQEASWYAQHDDHDFDRVIEDEIRLVHGTIPPAPTYREV